jgi:hypothetical protein
MSYELENSDESGFNSIPDRAEADMFDSKLSIAAFNPEGLLLLDDKEEESKYFSVSNSRVAVRYRFLPAILIEFPNAESSDWKYASIPKLLIINKVSIIIKILILTMIFDFIFSSIIGNPAFIHTL